MAKKKNRIPRGVNVPGYPPNVRLTPGALDILAAEGRLPGGNQPTNLQQNMAQLGPQTPQSYQVPSASLPLQQGPLAGMVGNLNQNPMQGNFFGGNIPQPTQQNTQIPSQYLDPQRNQPADPTKWYHYLAGPFIGAAAPNTSAGRWWNDLLWGEPPKVEGANRFTEFQQKLLNLLAQGGAQGLSQTPFNFAPIANQQLERFYTNTVPTLAERFTAMGDGQRSSAFQGALANAGRFLGNDLGALQGQYNLQQQGNLLNMLNLGLTPQYEKFVNPGTTGLIPGGVKAGTELGKAYIKSGGTGLPS